MAKRYYKAEIVTLGGLGDFPDVATQLKSVIENSVQGALSEISQEAGRSVSLVDVQVIPSNVATIAFVVSVLAEEADDTSATAKEGLPTTPSMFNMPGRADGESG